LSAKGGRLCLHGSGKRQCDKGVKYPHGEVFVSEKANLTAKIEGRAAAIRPFSTKGRNSPVGGANVAVAKARVAWIGFIPIFFAKPVETGGKTGEKHARCLDAFLYFCPIKRRPGYG